MKKKVKNEYNNTDIEKKMEEIMGYRIGFDIGSTTIKAVVLDENNQICYKSYERHKAQVRQKSFR